MNNGSASGATVPVSRCAKIVNVAAGTGNSLCEEITTTITYLVEDPANCTCTPKNVNCDWRTGCPDCSNEVTITIVTGDNSGCGGAGEGPVGGGTPTTGGPSGGGSGGGPPPPYYPCANNSPIPALLPEPLPPCPPPGGAGGYTPGSPGPGPCDKVAPLKTDSLFKESVNELRSRTVENREYAYLHKSDGGRIGIYSGTPNDCEVNVPIFNSTPKLRGYIHSHNNACPLPIFSPSDFKTLFDLFTLGKTDSVFTFGLVTDSATYLMVIDDPASFQSFGSQYFFESSSFDTKDLENRYKSYKINRANGTLLNETKFLRFLKKENIAVKILKSNSDLSGYSQLILNRDNSLVSIPCN